MGNVLRQLREPDAALAAYDRAIAAKPDYAEAHYNRSAVPHQAGQGSDHADAYRNLGLVQQKTGQMLP